MEKITFRQAIADDALFISEGFHMAMLISNPPKERIALFAEKICSRNDVLYSAQNTILAEKDGKPVGMITSYDGKNYSAFRKTTMALVKEHLGIEFPGMEDEAAEGEDYLDSLAVLPECRGLKVGTRLLKEAISRGHALGLPVTLVVDPDNPKARKLYESLGFSFLRKIFIFGHHYDKMILRA